jgi:hypothetical protein
MSLRQLPTRRRRAWLPNGEGEHTSRAPATTDSADRWSPRPVLKWGVASLAIVAGFSVSVFLFLMATVPEPTSYMG